jgi:hypothetical protein
MKILWMSDSPTSPTGFGNVTRAVCAGLADYGHQVSILGWQTLNQERWHDCTVYPLPLQHNPAPDVLLGYLRKIRPDVVVMLGEVWLFPYFHHPIIADFLRTAGIAWALY